MKRLVSFVSPFGLLALVSCGESPTQFSTPESYRVSFNVSGSGVDNVKQLLSEAAAKGADKVLLDPAVSSTQEADSVAELEKSIKDILPSDGSSTSEGSGSSSSGTSSSTSSAGSSSGSTTSSSSSSSTPSSNSSSGSTTASTSSGSSSTSTSSATPPFKFSSTPKLGDLAGNSLVKIINACGAAFGTTANPNDPSAASGAVLFDSTKTYGPNHVPVIYVASGKAIKFEPKSTSGGLRGLCILLHNESSFEASLGAYKLGGILNFGQGSSSTGKYVFGAEGKVDAAMGLANGLMHNLALCNSKVLSLLWNPKNVTVNKDCAQ